ncbi:MAG TPA: LCP family protein [Candidatus Limnocylindria bacterium]|nr:LCP family protein [Candidatus Limnocylindria bacterium]
MQRNAAILIGLAVVVLAAIIAFLLLSRPPAAEPSPPASASASASAEASTEPSIEPSATLNADLLERRWTVLFVGIDANASREADPEFVPNADAIMLVSLSEDQSELTLVSLPRDTVDVPLPDGGVWDRKINALWSEGGPDALVGAMETLFDVPIDGYLALDMDDFTALVDAVGGVQVSPDAPLVDPKVDLNLQPGPQEIDAETANGYVRTRVDQDYGRMARQQEVLLALASELADPETQVDLAQLVEDLESLQTDLPLDEFPTLVELMRRATDAEVQTLVIQPPLIVFEGDRGDGRGYVLEPDVEAIRAEVRELIGE